MGKFAHAHLNFVHFLRPFPTFIPIYYDFCVKPPSKTRLFALIAIEVILLLNRFEFFHSINCVFISIIQVFWGNSPTHTLIFVRFLRIFPTFIPISCHFCESIIKKQGYLCQPQPRQCFLSEHFNVFCLINYAFPLLIYAFNLINREMWCDFPILFR